MFQFSRFDTCLTCMTVVLHVCHTYNMCATEVVRWRTWTRKVNSSLLARPFEIWCKKLRWPDLSKLTSRDVPCTTVQFGRLRPPVWPDQFIGNKILSLATGRNNIRWQRTFELTSMEVACITFQFGPLWPPVWPGQFIENRRLSLATGRNNTW